MATSVSERCFSTLKRVFTFLRSTMRSIEKDLVADIPNFNNKVIDIFASRKNRR